MGLWDFLTSPVFSAVSGALTAIVQVTVGKWFELKLARENNANQQALRKMELTESEIHEKGGIIKQSIVTAADLRKDDNATYIAVKQVDNQRAKDEMEHETRILADWHPRTWFGRLFESLGYWQMVQLQFIRGTVRPFSCYIVLISVNAAIGFILHTLLVDDLIKKMEHKELVVLLFAILNIGVFELSYILTYYFDAGRKPKPPQFGAPISGGGPCGVPVNPDAEDLEDASAATIIQNATGEAETALNSTHLVSEGNDSAQPQNSQPDPHSASPSPEALGSGMSDDKLRTWRKDNGYPEDSNMTPKDAAP